MKIKIGIAENMDLMLRAIAEYVNSIPECEVIIEAIDGLDLIKKLERAPELPDIILMDISMPIMNGVEATRYIIDKYPAIKIAALSSRSVDSMMDAGACAYLEKDMLGEKFKRAILEIHETGAFDSDPVNMEYKKTKRYRKKLMLNDKELQFLRLACIGYNNKEIANQMFVSVRTVEGYSSAVLSKLDVANRATMIVEALRREIVSIEK